MELHEFKEKLNELYNNQEYFLKQEYGRSLSFQDGLFDRFERAKRLGFGEDASIYNSALVFGNVTVGKKTWIGPNVILDGSGGSLVIGNYCSISAGVHVYTHDTVMWALSGGKEQAHKAGVLIGSNTYIGAQAIIKAGIKIGSHCVIGANSFVNKDVENNTIVAGSPAKVIGRVIFKSKKIELQYEECHGNING